MCVGNRPFPVVLWDCVWDQHWLQLKLEEVEQVVWIGMAPWKSSKALSNCAFVRLRFRQACRRKYTLWVILHLLHLVSPNLEARSEVSGYPQSAVFALRVHISPHHTQLTGSCLCVFLLTTMQFYRSLYGNSGGKDVALTYSVCCCSQVRSLAHTVEALKQSRRPWILSF